MRGEDAGGVSSAEGGGARRQRGGAAAVAASRCDGAAVAAAEGSGGDGSRRRRRMATVAVVRYPAPSPASDSLPGDRFPSLVCPSSDRGRWTFFYRARACSHYDDFAIGIGENVARGVGAEDVVRTEYEGCSLWGRKTRAVKMKAAARTKSPGFPRGSGQRRSCRGTQLGILLWGRVPDLGRVCGAPVVLRSRPVESCS